MGNRTYHITHFETAASARPAYCRWPPGGPTTAAGPAVVVAAAEAAVGVPGPAAPCPRPACSPTGGVGGPRLETGLGWPPGGMLRRSASPTSSW